jgi:glutathione S-transferase
MEGSIVFGYWNNRGRGQVPRLLLAYTKADWTDKKYIKEDEWFGPGKDKMSLNLPLPNLPYLIHDEVKITQSIAITNYIINISGKTELLGKDLKDQTILDCLRSNMEDIFAKIVEIYYYP